MSCGTFCPRIDNNYKNMRNCSMPLSQPGRVATLQASVRNWLAAGSPKLKYLDGEAMDPHLADFCIRSDVLYLRSTRCTGCMTSGACKECTRLGQSKALASWVACWSYKIDLSAYFRAVSVGRPSACEDIRKRIRSRDYARAGLAGQDFGCFCGKALSIQERILARKLRSIPATRHTQSSLAWLQTFAHVKVGRGSRARGSIHVRSIPAFFHLRTCALFAILYLAVARLELVFCTTLEYVGVKSC